MIGALADGTVSLESAMERPAYWLEERVKEIVLSYQNLIPRQS